MKRILICTNSFYPSYKSGGPVRSLTNLVDLISGKYSIDVYTRDRDLGDKTSFKNIKVNSWSNKYNGASVFYSDGSISIKKLISDVFRKKYDVVYLNGFFDFKFSIIIYALCLLGFISHKEIVLAPRGELTKGAMSLKWFKKKVFLGVFLLFRLHKKIKFHLTSEQEFREFNTYIKTENFIICPNMHESLPEYYNKKKNVNQLKILFLSRISKKKNLEYAINILSKVHIPEGSEITFNIVGTIEDDSYFERCKILANKVENVDFIFHGAATRSEVKDFMSNSHVFLLPTLNENYGHAIVEAMVNSNVVIISDNTPWNEVNNFGSLALSLDNMVPFVKGIENVLCMSNDEFNLATKNTYSFINKSLGDNEEKIKNFFG